VQKQPGQVGWNKRSGSTSSTNSAFTLFLNCYLQPGWVDRLEQRTEQRQRNLGAVVNNARFLILPWIRVPQKVVISHRFGEDHKLLKLQVDFQGDLDGQEVEIDGTQGENAVSASLHFPSA
jgi:hypothetical protein